MQGCYLFLGGGADGKMFDDIEPSEIINIPKKEAMGYTIEAYFKISVSTQERSWFVYVYNNDKKILARYIDILDRQGSSKWRAEHVLQRPK